MRWICRKIKPLGLGVKWRDRLAKILVAMVGNSQRLLPAKELFSIPSDCQAINELSDISKLDRAYRFQENPRKS
jgi:hypothetical protein